MLLARTESRKMTKVEIWGWKTHERKQAKFMSNSVMGMPCRGADGSLCVCERNGKNKQEGESGKKSH